MKAFRYLLKGLFTWLRVPVWRGPLRGWWFSVFSGMRFIRGTYDDEQVQMILQTLQPGDVFYDIGAHVGYYSLAASRRVGPDGRVVAFEPLPLNLRMLRGHVAANRIANIDVIAAGVSDSRGEACFDLGKGTGRGRLGSGAGRLTVPLVTIDELVAQGRVRPPHFIKMDIEGAELSALRGARRTLSQGLPTVMLSVHSEQLKADCSRLLQEIGYRLLPTAKPGQLLAQRPV
ncbi:MAG TPA: FkbM family methyltransferase [Solimonas sp.]